MMISVVIPAHNEENTVGRCVDALLRGSRGQIEVIVVCNGCSDRTAEIAAAFGTPVQVIETEIASKPHALNLGDDAGTAYPRFYVDADVEVTGAALLEVARVLESGRFLAAAPSLRVDLTGCPWTVRAYYRIWCELPYVREALIGSGVYGLSREARGRFERFPDIIADDYYVRSLFTPAERTAVRSCEFVIRAPRTARDLIHRKVRVFTGNLQLGEHTERQSWLPDWLSAVARRPQLLPLLPIFLAISHLAKRAAYRRVRAGDFDTWNRDDSTRVGESI